MSLYQYAMDEFNLFQENKKKLILEIRKFPDNQNIQRINNHGFKISSNQLSNNWSVFYYDFQQQKDKLVELIEDSNNMLSIYNKLRDLIQTKSLYINKNTYKFNEEIIKNLEKII